MLRNVSKEYAEIAMDCVNAMDRADKCQRELEKIWEEHGEQQLHQSDRMPRPEPPA